MLKDPRARWSIVVPPVLQCLIFGYAATYDLNNVPYAVLDQDHSFASRDCSRASTASRVFQRVADLQRAADIARVIDNRDAILVIQVPQDFERDLLLGKAGERATNCRRPQFEHRGRGAGLCGRDRGRLQCGLARPAWRGPDLRSISLARLVQFQSRKRAGT